MPQNASKSMPSLHELIASIEVDNGKCSGDYNQEFVSTPNFNLSQLL